MKKVKDKKKIYTYCARQEIVEKFKKQSEEISMSVSERIEQFMKKEINKHGINNK